MKHVNQKCINCDLDKQPSEKYPRLCVDCEKLITVPSAEEVEDYESRTRLSEVDARKILTETTSNAILHLTKNEDGTFTIVGHIVCEYCDFCESQGDCRGRGDVQAVESKIRIYEKQAPYYYTKLP